MKHRQKQETHKGRGGLAPAGTSWVGWGYAEHAELITMYPPTYVMARSYSTRLLPVSRLFVFCG